MDLQSVFVPIIKLNLLSPFPTLSMYCVIRIVNLRCRLEILGIQKITEIVDISNSLFISTGVRLKNIFTIHTKTGF